MSAFKEVAFYNRKDFRHLKPMRWCYHAERNGEKKHYDVVIMFSDHCVSRKVTTGETADSRFCGNRVFDKKRLESSATLRANVKDLHQHSCYFNSTNQTYVAIIPNNNHFQLVAFRASHSENADARIVIMTSWACAEDPSRDSKYSPASFFTILAQAAASEITAPKAVKKPPSSHHKPATAARSSSSQPNPYSQNKRPKQKLHQSRTLKA